jgi:integrase
MGSLRRKPYTKPLPDGAEIFRRKDETFARWKDGRGKTRTAPVTTGADGSLRVVFTASTWTAKYRDGGGFIREVQTGCRDKTAAAQILRDLERESERIQSGVATAAEVKTVQRQQGAIGEHIAAFLDHRKARGRCSRPKETRHQLERVAGDCRFSKLSELDADAFETWLARQAEDGMSAGTRNKYRTTWVAFCNWAVDAGRMLRNPLARVAKADEGADVRRQRRALTESELVRLLDVARRRPILDASTVRRGKDAGKPTCQLRPETVERLERLGRERALIYKTLVLTGLRANELRTLTVGQLDLDHEPAFLKLDAANEKNREGSTLPLRSDLAADLRGWLADKVTERQDNAGNAARDAATVPFDRNALKPTGRDAGDSGRLAGDELIFDVPTGLVRILDRDLKLAGIPKVDDRGRTVDVHALRHTFGTHLSKSGVQPRTAQAAMRHSDINLTMGVYTDPRLLDLSAAVESLPSLPLDGTDREAGRATGTDGRAVVASPLLPPMLPLPLEHLCQSESILDHNAKPDVELPKREKPAISLGKRGFSRVSGKWATADLNRRPPPCEDGALTN